MADMTVRGIKDEDFAEFKALCDFRGIGITAAIKELIPAELERAKAQMNEQELSNFRGSVALHLQGLKNKR